MKKYRWQLALAGLLGVLAALIVWKLRPVVDAAFIITAVVGGFFIAKRNEKDAVDNITE